MLYFKIKINHFKEPNKKNIYKTIILLFIINLFLDKYQRYSFKIYRWQYDITTIFS